MPNLTDKIKIIFIGTPDFSVPCLKALINEKRFNVVAAITQPDKKVGRKQIVTPPPVKVEALKNNIPVFQPDKISNFKSEIFNLNPDLIIVVAYAQIIPKSILEIPKYGCINVHASLLPKYRGASCIQAPIINGDKETGVTIMKMDEGLDTGPILFQKTLTIENIDTGGTLFNKLSDFAAEIISPVLLKYISGEIKPVAQDNSKASYVGLLKKSNGKIDWNKDADEIEKFVRAMNPWPGAYSKLQITNYKLQILKIIEVEHETLKINKYKIGEIFFGDNKIAVQCGQDALVIKKLQLEGKNKISSEEFIRGYKNLVGAILE